MKDQRFSSLSDNFMIGRLLLDRTRSFGYEPNIILHNDDLQVLLYSLQKIIRFVCRRLNIMKWEKSGTEMDSFKR